MELFVWGKSSGALWNFIMGLMERNNYGSICAVYTAVCRCDSRRLQRAERARSSRPAAVVSRRHSRRRHRLRRLRGRTLHLRRRHRCRLLHAAERAGNNATSGVFTFSASSCTVQSTERTKSHQNRSNGCGDIAFNVFRNGGRPPSWIFRNLNFWTTFRSGVPMCTIVQNFIKIGQTVWWYCDFLIFKMTAVGHLGFSRFQTFSTYAVGRSNVHHHTEFHQNRSNGCGDMTFNVFQNGGHPPSWIFRNLNFLTAIEVQRANVHHHAKFRQNRPRWRQFAFFDLWNTFWDYPWRVFGGIYHYAKVGWKCRRQHAEKQKMPTLAALRHVMHFELCGWRRVFT